MDSTQWITLSMILLVNSVHSQIPIQGSESINVDPILKDSLLKLPMDELVTGNVKPRIMDDLKDEMSKNQSQPLAIIIKPESISMENTNKSMEQHNAERAVTKDNLEFNEGFNGEEATEISITEKSYEEETANEDYVTEVNDVTFIEEQNIKVIKNNLTEGNETLEDNPDAEVEEFVNSWKLGIPSDWVFTKAFVASLLVIIVSELGDKTFFIAAIMAMNNPRLIVFLGSGLALGGMHIIASLFGFVIAYIPRLYTFYASSALFIFFGLKMLWEAWRMNPEDAQEELEEVASDLRKREEEQQRRSSESWTQDNNLENQENSNNQDSDVIYQNPAFEANEATNNDAIVTIQESESGNNLESVRYFRGYTEENILSERPGVQEVTLTHRSRDSETNTVTRRQVEISSNVGQDAAEESSGTRAEQATKVLSMLKVMMTHPFFQAFSMTVLAEWGDRSQIATVIMGSTEDVGGIIVGGGIGHILCTGVAVLGGQLIATKISVRTVTFVGGIVFLLFAVVGLIMGPD